MNRITPVVKNLLIINVLFWLASMGLSKVGIDLIELCGLHYFQSSEFKPYQLITYMFLHDTSSFTHVFFNMFAVFMFGSVLENHWGHKRFFAFYMITGIGAAVIQMIIYYFRIRSLISQVPAEGFQSIMREGWQILQQHKNYTDPIMFNLNLLFNGTMVGASGAVFGLLLAFGMLFPNVPLYIMFIPIPIKAKYMVIGYGLIELLLGVADLRGDNIAHFAHLGGMIFGYILIKYWKAQETKRRWGG